MIHTPLPFFLNGKELHLFWAKLFPFVILKSVNTSNIRIIFLSYSYVVKVSCFSSIRHISFFLSFSNFMTNKLLLYKTLCPFVLHDVFSSSLFFFLTFCFAYILLTILISFTTVGCNQHYFSCNFLHFMFIILTTDTLISK